jgi:hypothetical protein
MRSAWNPAKEVRWRQVESNLFTIQFGCLADWNTATSEGPWLFRNQAVILQEYDGFRNPRSIVLGRVVVWARVLILPDNYLDKAYQRYVQKYGEYIRGTNSTPSGLCWCLCESKS